MGGSYSQHQQPLFQIVSDVHCEFYGDAAAEIQIPVVAPILLLPGDIGTCSDDAHGWRNLSAFLRRQCERYEFVLMCSGNHESYNCSLQVSTDRLRGLANEVANFVYMDCDAFDVPAEMCRRFNRPPTRVLGCALWSAITERGTQMLNDFRLIREFRADPDLYGTMHRRHVEWLEQEMQRAAAQNNNDVPLMEVVVMTHHAPFTDGLIPNVKVAGARHLLEGGCLGTDLVSDKRFAVSKYPFLLFWCYGHTHLSKRVKFDDFPLIVSNQMGYAHDKDGWPLWFFNKLVPGYCAYDENFCL